MPDFRYRNELIDDIVALAMFGMALVGAALAIDHYQEKAEQEAHAAAQVERDPMDFICWSILHDDLPVEGYTRADCLPDGDIEQ